MMTKENKKFHIYENEPFKVDALPINQIIYTLYTMLTKPILESEMQKKIQ